MDIESGPLSMDLDDGLVRLIDPETGEVIEKLGPIFDDECCPWELRDHWAYLLGRFHDATRAGKGCEAAAVFSYYERLSPANWN